MNDRVLRRILALFVVIFTGLTGVAVVAMHFVNVSGSNADWVNHINATIHEIDGISASVQAADGAMRAYALSGDPRDRAASREAFDDVVEHFDVAKPLTRDDPSTSPAVLSLEMLVQRRVELAQALWTAREQNEAQRLQALLASDAGSGAMAEIKRSAAKIREDQAARLTVADQIAFRNAQTTRWIVWTGLAANVVLLLAVAWLIREAFNARRLLATALEEANARLETQVRERTAELTASNQDLKTQSLETRWSNLAMEHQNRYNDLIINTVSEPVFVLTRALNITRANPAAVQITGLGEVDLLNKPLEQTVRLGAATPDGTPSFDLIASSLRNGRELRGLAAVLTDRRQRQIPVRINLLPLRDRDKVVGAIVTVVRETPGPT